MNDQVLKTKHSALQIDHPPNILKQMITYRDKHWYNTGKMFHITLSLIKPFTKKSPPYNSYSTSHKGASYLYRLPIKSDKYRMIDKNINL